MKDYIWNLSFVWTGVAYCNNKVTQRKIAEEGAIPTLVTYLNQPPSEEVQVEVAIALGCIVLSNTRNQELLQEEPGFNFDVLLDLLKSKSEVSFPEHLHVKKSAEQRAIFSLVFRYM